MAEEVIYKPSEWGVRYHYMKNERGDTIREILGAGAAGPGKSLILLMDPIDKVIIEDKRCKDKHHKYHFEPGNSLGWALHLRRTRPMLEQTIARSHRMFRGIDPDARWDQNKTMWTFSSGYKYQFGHCKDPNDWEQYMSNEYDHICYDELVQFDEEQYDQINTRLRSSDPILATLLKIRAMSNPLMRRQTGDNFSVRNPHWVRDRFVRPCPEGDVLFKKKIIRADGTISYHTWCYLPATLYHNPDKAFVKQYEATLLAAKPHIRNALLYGRWDASEHSFFDEWNPQLHVIKPFRVPEEWTFFRSMDWGFKQPGCVHWWSMDPDENLYCIKELTFQGKLVPEVCEMIEDIERDLGLWDAKAKRSLITGPADTQIWEQRGGASKSMYQLFVEAGIPWVQADKKSRQTNAQHLASRLADHDNGTKQPGVVFFETCKKLIETLPAVQGTPGDPDTPEEGGEDHWTDSCVEAGTLLLTWKHGWIPISEVKPGEYVLSADGRFWPCSGGRRTREWAKIFRVSFDNGTHLLATSDHRVLTMSGEWKRIDSLDSTCYAYDPWIRSLSLEHAKNSSGSATISAGSTSGEAETSRSSTGLSGPRILGESPSTGIISITWMKIALTMLFLTCAKCVGQIIALFTRVKCRLMGDLASRRPGPWSSQRSGIVRQMALSGIGDMPQRAYCSSVEIEDSLVYVAGSLRSTGVHRKTPSFVQAPVEPRIEEIADSTMSSELALPVGELSWSAGSRVPAPAQGSARRVLSVQFERADEVWCTTVPVMGSFVANGVVVSNCWYAAAYSAKGRKSIPKRKHKPDEWEKEVEPRRKKSSTGFGYGSRV